MWYFNIYCGKPLDPDSHHKNNVVYFTRMRPRKLGSYRHLLKNELSCDFGWACVQRLNPILHFNTIYSGNVIY